MSIKQITKLKAKELINKAHDYRIHFKAWLKGCQITKQILSQGPKNNLHNIINLVLL